MDRTFRHFILTKHQEPNADKDEIEKLEKLTYVPTDTDTMQQYLELLEDVDGIVPFKSRVAAMTKSA